MKEKNATNQNNPQKHYKSRNTKLIKENSTKKHTRADLSILQLLILTIVNAMKKRCHQTHSNMNRTVEVSRFKTSKLVKPTRALFTKKYPPKNTYKIA